MRTVEAVPWVILGLLIILYFLMFVYIYVKTTSIVTEKGDNVEGIPINVKTTSGVIEKEENGAGELNLETTSSVVEKEDNEEGILNVKTTRFISDQEISSIASESTLNMKTGKDMKGFDYNMYDEINDEINNFWREVNKGNSDNLSWLRNVRSVKGTIEPNDPSHHFFP